MHVCESLFIRAVHACAETLPALSLPAALLHVKSLRWCVDVRSMLPEVNHRFENRPAHVMHDSQQGPTKAALYLRQARVTCRRHAGSDKCHCETSNVQGQHVETI